MNEEKVYFTITEALQDIKEVLEGGYDSYLCDLHHEVFNTDYYIIGTHLAKQALTQYGVFEAMEEIQEYEKDNFGETCTDISNPEKVANMLYYIIGEKAIAAVAENNELYSDAWDDLLEDETRQSLIDTINDLLEAEREA